MCEDNKRYVTLNKKWREIMLAIIEEIRNEDAERKAYFQIIGYKKYNRIMRKKPPRYNR